MTAIPKRRRPPKMGLRVSNVIRCHSHLQFVRGCECSVKDKPFAAHDPCWGPIEAHHVRTRGAGGGDEQVVPLCRGHHAQLDTPGWSSKRFEQVYNIDLTETAAMLWLISPAGKRHRAKAMDND